MTSSEPRGVQLADVTRKVHRSAMASSSCHVGARTGDVGAAFLWPAGNACRLLKAAGWRDVGRTAEGGE